MADNEDQTKLTWERWRRQMSEEQTEIRALLAALKDYPEPGYAQQRASWARRLEDLFRTRREVTFMTEALEDIIYNIIPAETDKLACAELFGAAETGLGKNPSVDISLDGLVAKISDDNSAWTMNVLLLMARWGHRKYLPLVQKYLTHPHKGIRQNAEYAWKYQYKQFSEEDADDGA